MAKWLSPTLLLCAALTCRAVLCCQDAPSENPPPAVAPELATQPTAVDAILIQVPEPPAEGTPADPPDPVTVESSRPSSAPSEWHTLGTQWEGLVPNLLRDQKTI